MAPDIHHIQRQYDNATQKIQQLPPQQAQPLQNYLNTTTLKGISLTRRLTYTRFLLPLAQQHTKPIDTLTKEELNTYLANYLKKPQAAWTRCTAFGVFKAYYTSIGQKEKVAHLKVYPSRHERKGISPEELLTETEVYEATTKTPELLIKAAIEVVFETGLRAGELLTMNYSDVHRDADGWVANVTGKTGPRLVRFFDKWGYFARYYAAHRSSEDGAGVVPLWLGGRNCGRKMEGLSYSALRLKVRRAFVLAGVRKRVWLHLFRHSEATLYAGYLTEAQSCVRHGWAVGSRMPGVYHHLSGADVDRSVVAARRRMEQDSEA